MTDELFVKLPFAVLRSTRLSATAKHLLAVLEFRRNKNTDQCNRKAENLAAEMAVSKRTVRRAIAELRETGFIVEQRHGRRSDTYILAPVLEWPTLASLKKFRVAKSGQFNVAKSGHSGGSPSLYEKNSLKRRASAAADAAAGSAKGSESEPRKQPTAAAATNKFSQKNEPQNKLRELARSLTAELLKEHPEKGLPEQAPPLLEEILNTRSDPEKAAEEIRASHAAWQLVWNAKRAHNPHAFIPQLWRWFRDGDYKNAPTAPTRKEPGSERRKSRVEEMLDAL